MYESLEIVEEDELPLASSNNSIQNASLQQLMIGRNREVNRFHLNISCENSIGMEENPIKFVSVKKPKAQKRQAADNAS